LWIWLVVPAFLLAGDVAKQPEAKKPANCQLILEGRHIEKLVLSDRQGRVTELVRPGDRVLLPAGDYQIDDIVVKGGYTCDWQFPLAWPQLPSRWPPQSERRITLSHDSPCRPNIGTPLKPEITAKRVGRLMKVSYSLWLRDGGARGYSNPNSRNALFPQFAVYQGDRDVTSLGSGSLEYG
jgi:hypothetical protein